MAHVMISIPSSDRVDARISAETVVADRTLPAKVHVWMGDATVTLSIEQARTLRDRLDAHLKAHEITEAARTEAAERFDALVADEVQP